MSKTSRRTLIQGIAGFSGLAALTPLHAWQGKADIILSGGTFYTMDPALKNVEAVAIRGNRILAVGSVDDIANLAGVATRTIDTRGLTITIRASLIRTRTRFLLTRLSVSMLIFGPFPRSSVSASRQGGKTHHPGTGWPVTCTTTRSLTRGAL